MKDYDRVIAWLDYFNSRLSRSMGRKVPLSNAVRDPTLEELKLAAERLGYAPEVVEAKHPKRTFAASGYISIEKKKAKGGRTKLLRELASSLSSVRGEGLSKKLSSGPG